MYGSILVVFKIRKTLIPGAGILGIVHVRDVHDYPVDDLGLAILLGVERNGIHDLGVQQ
jgi:hypothetical protein